MKKSTVLILNYNGKQLLKKNLPAIIKSALYAGCDVAVADNGSQDGSGDFIKKEFPKIQLIQFSKNLGFGEGNNQAVRKFKSDIVILFNNDIVPQERSISGLIKHFSNQDVFAVACRQVVKTKQGQFSGGSAVGEFSRGLLRHKPTTTSLNYASPALFASGGAAAFDRKKFLELGGFDGLYMPFYWEDADLSARAWARGWRILHEPASIVEHRHETTIKKFYPLWYVTAIGARNMFIYNWRHLNGFWFWARHFAWLPFQATRRPLAFLFALPKIPAIIMRRSKDSHKLDLAHVLGLCKQA